MNKNHWHLEDIKKQSRFFNQLDPRVKVLGFFLLIILSSMLKNFIPLFLNLCLAFILVLLARLPLSFLASRFLYFFVFAGIFIVILPLVTPGEQAFALGPIIFSKAGLIKGAVIGLRLIAIWLYISLMLGSTGFRDFLWALFRLRLPQEFIGIIEFMLRYLALFTEEFKKAQTARKARLFQEGKSLWHKRTFKVLGQTVGMLFYRAYLRGERVHRAMLARGFRGQWPVLEEKSIGQRDLVFFLLLVFWVLTLLDFENRGLAWQLIWRLIG
ncbi:cobalt ECF transporter T component CbiQ [Carboxydothermus pertinax]|uniref:Cobalt ECF transporter T component CbiQ n=1 Tax=Carboxydothermus pertinax TaxID=870242 RepID=A0A1L8CXB4_9THEO|nr:cobalt ECF transporter T component CbiQ [Carboxydothermus pertinax]GAV23576.1 cobalt ECF transporter T component CbiQ [Carboxydothermus pertinax]